jgi:hypothetical protein
MEGERGAPAPDAGSRPEARLPYEKPAVAWEQPLETQPSLMTGCAKVMGESDPCTAAASS